MNKLGIIVPYRNRHEHLEQFKEHITSYLDSNSYDDYVVIVVEQDDANLLFLDGMLKSKTKDHFLIAEPHHRFDYEKK